MITRSKQVVFAVVFFLILSGCARRPFPSDPEGQSPGARNVIFMVADGLGLADVTAARIYKFGPGGPALDMELANVGYQRTYSAGSAVTDSAAAASAWACGEKFKNGEICFHGPAGRHRDSLLELAGKAGKATGLVVTSEITDATPAAFAAHVPIRQCQSEIARQYVTITGVDVLLGGGAGHFRSRTPDPCGTSGDFIGEAVANGYAFAGNRLEMEEAVKNGAAKLLGIFAESTLTPELGRTIDSPQPRLPEMTVNALRVLEKGRNGFFLLVEGSLIDRANHARNVEGQILETLAFDEAVRVVLDWVKADPAREGETLIIILADHETGGFAITGPTKSIPRKGDIVEAGWVHSAHTGTDVMVWSQGPGSGELNKPALENTDIHKVVRKYMQHLVIITK